MDDRVLFVGVDEVGYGPTLGPLVVAATMFCGTQRHQEMDWWELLATGVSRTGDAGRLPIDDSKAILRGKGGSARLSLGVAGLLRGHPKRFPGILPLIRRDARRDEQALQREHWFARSQQPAPRSNRWRTHWQQVPVDSLTRFRKTLHSASLTLGRPLVRVMFPKEFNERIVSLGSKAELVIMLVKDLVAGAIQLAPASTTRIHVTVDHLGGRRYYRSLVEEMTDGAVVFTTQEDREVSSYACTMRGLTLTFHFRVKADQVSLPVSAASMIAKYFRERCMEEFNGFWADHVPGLVATAGYPQDAKRFLADIRSDIVRQGIPMKEIKRAK